MSRRQRERANSRPWRHPSPAEPAIDWQALAADLQVPRAQVAAVAASLRQAETAGIDLERVRVRAAAALAAGDADAALPLYAQWLAVAPDDSAALEGREDALSLLLERVPTALHEGDLSAAARWLEQARRQDPGHVDLPGLRAAWAQAGAKLCACNTPSHALAGWASAQRCAPDTD